MDIAGASFLALGLLVSRARAVELSGTYRMGETEEENLGNPPIKDRIRQSRNAMIGLPLQIAGLWL